MMSVPPQTNLTPITLIRLLIKILGYSIIQNNYLLHVSSAVLICLYSKKNDWRMACD